MVLLVAHQGLVDFLTVVFVISGILFLIGCIFNAEALSRKIGLPSWKEWWKELKKH